MKLLCIAMDVSGWDGWPGQTLRVDGEITLGKLIVRCPAGGRQGDVGRCQHLILCKREPEWGHWDIGQRGAGHPGFTCPRER